MTNPNPPDFDIYPELDRQIDAAVQQEQGSEPPPGLGAVVAKEVYSGGETEPYSREELEEWAIPQLEIALNSWQRYAKSTPTFERIPFSDLERSLRNNDPKLMATLARLQETQDRLTDHGPEGLKGGTGLQIVIMPWEAMLKNLNQLQFWLKAKRDVQGFGDDGSIEPLKPFIDQDLPWYRDPDDPAKLLTSTQYLFKKTQRDGPIGLMLVQSKQFTSNKASDGESPNSLTSDGTQHWTTQDDQDPKRTYDLDALGYFEWLALTLQDDKFTEIASASWLLANRIPKIEGYTDSPIIPVGNIDFLLGSNATRTTLTSGAPHLVNDASSAFEIRIAIA